MFIEKNENRFIQSKDREQDSTIQHKEKKILTIIAAKQVIKMQNAKRYKRFGTA